MARTFEWKCPDCGAHMETAAVQTPLCLHESTKGLGSGVELVAMRRVYSFGLVWPKDKRGH